MLNPYDIVGVSFWCMTIVTLLTTVFLLLERQTVSVHWRLPITLSSLVMLLSFIHYYEMRELWLVHQNVAMSFRYLEWLISFPLQLLVLYFLLQVGSRRDCCLLTKFVTVPVVMLSLGYLQEVGLLTGWWVLVVIASLWVFLLHILWLGRGNRAMLSMINLAGRAAYRYLRWVITIGWLVYPVAYYLGSTQTLNIEWVNIMLNELDCLNKVGFVLIVWYAAYKDSGLLNTE